MTELVTVGETPLRFSPPNNQRLVSARETSLYADGMSSNVAITAQQLGAETLWLSRLPDTPLGQRVVKQVQEHGVETDITWTREETHRQGLVFHESGVTPRASQQWHDRGDVAFAYSSPSDFPMNVVQDTEILFTDLSTAVLSKQSAETLRALLRASSGGGALTAIGIDYAPELASVESYRGVFDGLSPEIDAVFANEADARTILDQTGGARELANLLAAEYDLDIAVVTRSERGAVALRNSPGTNIIHERDAIETDAVDPTGARSAFIGAFLEEHLREADTARALSVAVASAILTRTVTGPYYNATDDELESLVEDVINHSK